MRGFRRTSRKTSLQAFQLDNTNNRPLIREFSTDVTGLLLTIWSLDGTKRQEIRKGEDVLMEAFLGASCTICWSASGSQQEFLPVPDDTSWIWILRASDSSTTTVRCYSRKPLPEKHLKCLKGHRLRRGLGASGVFRLVDPRRTCARCQLQLSRGTLRWLCPLCNAARELCFNCAEDESWQQAERPEGMSRLEEFVNIDKVNAKSPGKPLSPSSGEASPSSPRQHLRRVSRSEGPVRHSRRELEHAKRLDAVPFLGVRPLARIQQDTMARLARLVRHGDGSGAWRLLARAQQLNIPTEDLAAMEAAVRSLERESDFTLLHEPPSLPEEEEQCERRQQGQPEEDKQQEEQLEEQLEEKREQATAGAEAGSMPRHLVDPLGGILVR